MMGLIWVHKDCKDCSKLTLAVQELKDLQGILDNYLCSVPNCAMGESSKFPKS